MKTAAGAEDKEDAGQDIDIIARSPSRALICQALQEMAKGLLQDMFDRICKVPEKLPEALRVTKQRRAHYSSHGARTTALEANRANIHVTQLWARYLIFDRLVSAHRQSSAQENLPPAQIQSLAAFVQSEHETICDQLLHFLQSIEIQSLESNGVSISYKIRQVASLLLDYQAASTGQNRRGEDTTLYSIANSSHYSADAHAQNRGLTERAQHYINQFLDLLTRLEQASSQEMQRLICRDAWERLQNWPVS